MKHQHDKLNQEEQESASTHQKNAARQTMHEFATAEEAIRHDARQTEVPPSIGERLRDSVAREPSKPRSWWRRLFSK